MNEILQSLKSDLLDRRMLPILVLLVAAVAGAIAYTVLAGHGSSGTPAAAAAGPVAPPTQGPALAVQQAPENPNGAVAETTDGARYQHKPGSHDPFTPLPGAVKQEKTAATSTSSSTSSSSSSSSESKPSSSTGGSSTTTTQPTQPTKPTTPTKKPKPKPAYVVSLQFGQLSTAPEAPVQLIPYELRTRRQLPSASAPKIVFTGVHGTPFEAIFALTAEVIPKGEGVCLPSTSQCEAIELAAGKSEQLEYLEPTGQTVVYELKVVSIARPEGAAAARIARRRHHRHHHSNHG